MLLWRPLWRSAGRGGRSTSPVACCRGVAADVRRQGSSSSPSTPAVRVMFKKRRALYCCCSPGAVVGCVNLATRHRLQPHLGLPRPAPHTWETKGLSPTRRQRGSGALSHLSRVLPAPNTDNKYLASRRSVQTECPRVPARWYGAHAVGRTSTHSHSHDVTHRQYRVTVT